MIRLSRTTGTVHERAAEAVGEARVEVEPGSDCPSRMTSAWSARCQSLRGSQSSKSVRSVSSQPTGMSRSSAAWSSRADGVGRADDGGHLVRICDSSLVDDLADRRDRGGPTVKLVRDVEGRVRRFGKEADGRGDEDPGVCAGREREAGRDRPGGELARDERAGARGVEREREERRGEPVRLRDAAPEREDEEGREREGERGEEEARDHVVIAARPEEIARDERGCDEENGRDVEALPAEDRTGGYETRSQRWTGCRPRRWRRRSGKPLRASKATTGKATSAPAASPAQGQSVRA